MDIANNPQARPVALSIMSQIHFDQLG